MERLRFATGAMLGAVKSAGAFVLAALVMSAPVLAQNWIKVPPPIVPRTADGKPDLQAPTPRTPDGKPDLTGPWSSKDNSFLRDIAREMPPDAVPFQPWAKELFDRRKDGSLSREDPDANPTWHGYSTGRWDGDTLVVETRGFNGKAWLDQLGRPTTDALHVTERFRRKDVGHMEIQITIDDPKAYTRPWGLTEEVGLVLGTDLMEFICNENNRDLEHLPGNTTRSRR
jgi:hypothetical protein